MQSRDAIIAKRADEGSPDTEEIRKLAEAAGYEVVGELTQTRAADSTYQFGRGKAEELAALVAETGATTVVFDNELTPTQSFELGELLPEESSVLDRHRLVLDIFEEQAGTRRAKLQVERAQLAYALPRIREETTRELGGEDLQHDEKGGQRVLDIERRIDELNRKLDELGDTDEQSSSSSATGSHHTDEQSSSSSATGSHHTEARRKRRREEGFELVALAGYTNAGKSTLLHCLADDLDFDASEPDHADLDGTAEIEDRLFKTLDTTTRRATIDGRRTLVTDTVGFVDDLPHELVRSFHGTLSATESADCAVLVADASDSLTDLRRKLETSYDLLDGAEGTVLTVLNKVDLRSPGELAERERAVSELADESDVSLADDPIAISATEDANLDALRERIAAALPNLREAELVLPNDGKAMSLVSWLYDRTRVEDVTYADETVRIEFAGRPPVVEKAKAKADALAVRG